MAVSGKRARRASVSAPAPAQWVLPVKRSNYGGVWLRLLAYYVDLLVNADIIALIYRQVVGQPVELVHGFLHFKIVPALFLAFWISSSALFLGTRPGTTLGKYLLGMRVIAADGNHPSLRQAYIRESIKTVLGFLLVPGIVVAWLTGKRQALHDLVANTFVLRKVEEGVWKVWTRVMGALVLSALLLVLLGKLIQTYVH